MRPALALLCCACATVGPSKPGPAAAPKPAPTEAELLAPKLAALEQHAAAIDTARDDAVWAFWLGGAPSAADPWAGHEQMLHDDALAVLRRARELKLSEPATLDRLEAQVVGKRVVLAVRETETMVSNLEATLRFEFEGREVLYRELGAALAAEKLPQRRKALWASSLAAAKQLAAALAQRDEAHRAALEALGHTPESFAALLGRTELPAAAQQADRLLLATEARWKARLAAQRITSRADLPAMLKPSGPLDAAFPKARIAERGTQVLASLGLYGLPRLTIDLTDSPRKQPLPLTVSGVRSSFKPRGGFKDQGALLAELGRALALRHAPKARRRTVETTAALFGSLAWNPAWLEEQQLAAPLVAAAVELGRDTLLLQLRRAAGGLLGELDRAYALADDPARARLDVEPLFAGADTLHSQAAAFALARHLEAQGPKWWQSPGSADVLREFWKSGELPEAVRAGAESGAPLLDALGVERPPVSPSEGTAPDPPAR